MQRLAEACRGCGESAAWELQQGAQAAAGAARRFAQRTRQLRWVTATGSVLVRQILRTSYMRHDRGHFAAPQDGLLASREPVASSWAVPGPPCHPTALASTVQLRVKDLPCGLGVVCLTGAACLPCYVLIQQGRCAAEPHASCWGIFMLPPVRQGTWRLLRLALVQPGRWRWMIPLALALCGCGPDLES